MRTRLARAGLALCAAVLLGGPLSAETREYAVGQVWAFETAPQDKGALIQIREIGEIGPPEAPVTVYHISMIGVAIPGEAEPLEIAHLPVSRQTLDSSVTVQAATAPAFPAHAEGKAEWEAAEGGVFTIPLRQIADILREQVARMRSTAGESRH